MARAWGARRHPRSLLFRERERERGTARCAAKYTLPIARLRPAHEIKSSDYAVGGGGGGGGGDSGVPRHQDAGQGGREGAFYYLGVGIVVIAIDGNFGCKDDC